MVARTRSYEKLAGIAELTDESVCPTWCTWLASWGAGASACQPGYFRIEYLSRSEISFRAPAGGAVWPFSTSLLSIFWPYNSVLASASLRSVAPVREMPAKIPLARDHARISAVILASVSALTVLPTGPAATEASAPKVNLSPSSLFMPSRFITSITTSVEEPPIWMPKLPPSIRTAPGAPHPVPSWWRHSAKPRPNSAPTTKAAFLSPGTMTTHCDLASKSCGIPLSGVLIISEKTVAVAASRSCAVSAAKAAIGSNKAALIAMRFIRISPDNYYRQLRHRVNACFVRKHSDKTNPAAGPLRSARPVKYKGSNLELDLSRHLDGTHRRVEAQEGTVNARRRTHRSPERPEGRIADGGVRVAEVRVVESVERLRANSQGHLFGDMEVAVQVQVYVEEMGPVKLVARLRRPFGKVVDHGAVQVHAGIEARHYGAARISIGGAATAAAPAFAKRRGINSSAPVAERGVVAVPHRVRDPSAPEELAGKLPAIHNRPQRPASGFDGRIDHEVAGEVVANVVIGVAVVVGLQAERIDLPRSAVSIGENAAVGALVDVVRPGVVEVECHRVGNPLGERDVQPVVVRNRAVLVLRHDSVIGHRNVRRDAGNARIQAVRIVGVRPGVGIQQALAVVAHVIHRQQRAVRELPLHLDVPFEPHGSLNGSVQAVHRRGREHRTQRRQLRGELAVGLVESEGIRRGLPGGRSAGWIEWQSPRGGTHADGHRRRRVGQQIVHQAGRRIVIGDHETAADHRLVIAPRRIAEADTGRYYHGVDTAICLVLAGSDVAAVGDVARVRAREARQTRRRPGEIRETVELAYRVGVPLHAQRQRELQAGSHGHLIL